MQKEKKQRKVEDYGDCGKDGLMPLEPLDLSRIKSIDELVRAMGKTSFNARRVGEAADILEAMAKDKGCLRVLTLSGAMTIAKMSLVICDMIDNDMVDVVISTGALMGHGLIEAAGFSHYKSEEEADDEKLYKKGYNRVYDTIEPETNFGKMTEVNHKVFSGLDEKEAHCSHSLCEALGKHLAENYKGRGVLKSAYEKKVPVFIPAFTDSELAFDFRIYNAMREKEGKSALKFEPFLDFDKYAEMVKESKKMGIFTIGGGVPRNWAQQACPYWDVYDEHMETESGLHRFDYAVRICPESEHWGGLSGCTYSEGVSWGKITPHAEGGMHTEVRADATTVWPMIVKAVLERLEK
ncbi:MAG: deoxyhypusine synthase family protein [archaeon]